MSICNLIDCSVCGVRRAKHIIHSSLISAQYPTCYECYNNNAEPRWIFNYLVENPEQVTHELIEGFNTYHEGKYISWNEYSGLRSTVLQSKDNQKQETI